MCKATQGTVSISSKTAIGFLYLKDMFDLQISEVSPTRDFNKE